MDKNKFRSDKRGIISVEASIVLISFVIVAVALALLVVNVGLFATQEGKQTIQQGISGSSTPLFVNGNILIRGNNAAAPSIDAMMIPLQTIGVRYVPMSQNLTQISLQVGNGTAYLDVYLGINNTLNPLNTTLDTLVSTVGNSTGATLFVGNSNGDNALDSNEKGYLIFHFAATDEPVENEPVQIAIKTDIGIPLSIDLVIPIQTTQGWQTLTG
jgi:flagellin-like protein